jgi:histidine ammonia-lyase
MITLDGTRLTAVDVAAVARGNEPVELSGGARERNAVARAAIAGLLAGGEPLYGSSTGVGALRDRAIGESEREQFQWNLLRSHSVGAGRTLAPEMVRAAMVVRANQLGAGGAGVAPELLDGLVTALNHNVVPYVRELGSLGTGDLAQLAAIALAILGDGWLLIDGQPIPAVPRTPRVALGLRDALGFMSSNAVCIGRTALLTIDAHALIDGWLATAALSFEALGADPVVLDEHVQAARGAPAQAAVAARMRELLAGAPAAAPADRKFVQDPYPFRVLPQVDGTTWAALTELEQVLARDLNGRLENALINGGRAWPNGNFHEAELASALDRLRAALAQSAGLIAARVSALLDPRMSNMSPFLAGRPGGESGMMMLEYTAHEAAAEARSLTLPMASQSVSASLGVESHASLASISVRRTVEVLELMRIVVATELTVAMRALRCAGRTPAGTGTAKLFALASNALPAGLDDRAFGGELATAAAVLARFSRGSAETELRALGDPARTQ